MAPHDAPGTNDRLPRVFALLGFSLLLAIRGRSFPGEAYVLPWILDLGYLSVAMLSYLIRLPVRGKAVGFAERYVPFLVATLSGVLVTLPLTHPQWMAVALPVMTCGGGLFCRGAWDLRRSLSVMVEARSLVDRGIYRYLRHPIYTGNLLAALGTTLLRLSPLTLVMFVGLVAGQLYRARMEEKKLTAFCPEYASYRRRIPMLSIRYPLSRAVLAPALSRRA